jgi:hypothetical protein
MAITYTQIHIQAVFAVQNRDCVIEKYGKANCTNTSQASFKITTISFLPSTVFTPICIFSLA